MTIEDVKELLRELRFPSSAISDQTALTLLALADRRPREGLLVGHSCLADGARIHDVLNFVREDFGRKVAENTRESYRKTSLRPLIDARWVVRHQLTTNDPNTYYRLSAELASLLAAESGPDRNRLVQKLRLGKTGKKTRGRRSDGVLVRLSADQSFLLGPGPHSELEREVVEVLAPALMRQPLVLYLGDTSPRAGFQDRALMRRLNLPIDVQESLPDVILYDDEERLLVIAETVTSVGPIDSTRLEQLRELVQGPLKLGVRIEYLTAFPTRRALRTFVEQIA
ncbi:MAG TPA: BsuBI/PstI family type II restriction endonuclease [Thermoanaerobaculia bacterium]|nr:BsuBI/PstI family type II restriction endonuclease [Thermoanaerobaculia bacterium]